MSAIAIEPDLAAEIAEKTGENVFLCYNCKKCTSGCPMGERMDLEPNQVLRSIQLGQTDRAINSKTIWLCLSCATCATRCPQGINLVKVMDFLRARAIEQNVEAPVQSVPIFHKSFLKWVNRTGRLYEAGLLADLQMKLATKGALDFQQLRKDAVVGLKMFAAGKLNPVPPLKILERKKGEKARFESAETIGYYPGCSLHSSAKEFDLSTKAVTADLGIELQEIEGWNCCGASSAHAIDHEAAITLPMKNLAIAERAGHDTVTTPCAMCFSQLKTASQAVREDADAKHTAVTRLGSVAGQDVRVQHLLDAIYERVGLDKVKANVKKPLEELKVVCYYGCLLTRPASVTQAEHPEYPMNMDRLMSALGAQVLDWSYKTECCGASMTLTEPEIVLELTNKIFKNAKAVGADAIVLACPMCHTNLDTRQAQVEAKYGESYGMPIFYFTELMGLAFGHNAKDLGWKHHLTDAAPLLVSKGIVEPHAAGRESSPIRWYVSGALAAGTAVAAGRAVRRRSRARTE